MKGDKDKPIGSKCRRIDIVDGRMYRNWRGHLTGEIGKKMSRRWRRQQEKESLDEEYNDER